ncbi:transcriptional regulator with XRE-family HTH domain [Actinopolyspora lacussalsi]|nr:transcriptional regulator with XRE-family HTH domain [Actinopolyspora lacussalsi]
MVRVPLSSDEMDRGRRLGAMIRAARGPESMNRTAEKAGISVETLRKIETGRIPTPAFFTIAALAGVLNISLDRLALHTDTAPDDPPHDESGRADAS